MIYRKDGFRAFYKELAAFRMKSRFRKGMQDFPGAEEADFLLTYGYIDHEQGFTLEVLAAGVKEEDAFHFFDGNDEKRFFIRVDALINDEAYWFKDEEGKLKARYEKKIEALKQYDVSENLEKTRQMTFLDGSRNEQFVDDVLVYLVRDGFLREACWIRIYDVGEHWIIGHLLNEPDQDFGFHEGDAVAFNVNKGKDGKVICFADLNPGAVLSKEDLRDGALLKAAVKIYHNERTREHFVDVLEFLRDSEVWLGPDLLRNGDRLYLPVFSGEEEMREEEPEDETAEETIAEAVNETEDETAEEDSSSEKPAEETAGPRRVSFLEVLKIVENSPYNIAGIVLNAYTDPFALDRSFFGLVANLEPRVNE